MGVIAKTGDLLMGNVIQLDDYKALQEEVDQKRLHEFFTENFVVLTLAESVFPSEEDVDQSSPEIGVAINLDFLLTPRQQKIYRLAIEAGVDHIEGFFSMLDRTETIYYDDLKI